jgi:hypothetical protein
MIQTTEYMLTVQRDELEKGIKTAVFGIKKKTTGNFALLYAKGQLTLRGPVAEATVPAKGNWPITVSLPVQIAKNLAKVLTASDTQHLRFKDGRLFIENFSIAAQKE